MASTVSFPDPQCFIELGQITPSPMKDSAPTVPCQTSSAWWNPPSLVTNNPTTHTFLNSSSPELTSLGLDSSFPSTIHPQLHPEGMGYFQRTGYNHHDPFPHVAHHQTTLSPQSIDPYLLLGDPSTTPAVPGYTVDQPFATPRSTASPVQDISMNRSTRYTENILQFLRMRSDSRYECLWDDGSGRLCGYSATLTGVKRHLRSRHCLKRSVSCPVCKKSLSSPYSLKLHGNQHTDENPYGCQDCELAFKSPNSRRYHRIHDHEYIPKKR